MPRFEVLSTTTLRTNNRLIHPLSLPELVRITDSAFSVMQDFKTFNPITINSHLSIDEALNLMKKKETTLLFVVNHDQKVIGILDSEDLLGEKPIQLTQEKRLPRHEILVSMVMTHPSKIVTFNLNQLRLAKVGHIVQTLKKLRAPYALAVTISEGSHVIRGFFSLSQISKQLHEDLHHIEFETESVLELRKRKVT